MGLSMKQGRDTFDFITRQDCHLCHVMEGLLDEVFKTQKVEYQRRDVDADPTLQELYGETVPVLLRNGKPVAKVRTDKSQLQRIIRRSR